MPKRTKTSTRAGEANYHFVSSDCQIHLGNHRMPEIVLGAKFEDLAEMVPHVSKIVELVLRIYF